MTSLEFRVLFSPGPTQRLSEGLNPEQPSNLVTIITSCYLVITLIHLKLPFFGGGNGVLEIAFDALFIDSSLVMILKDN